MTDEEKKKLRAVEAERTRQKRAQMTAEEIEKRRARDAAKKREKRLAISGCSTELQQVKAKNAEKYRQKSEKMTAEERQKRNARVAESVRKRRARMTEEELKQLHAQQSECHRQKWAQKTEEEKRRFKAVQFERRRLKENGTTVEKVRHMISLAGELARRNPARYEIAGTFFKNSLSEILNLHKEVETLRNNFQQNVSNAVKNALNVCIVGKQAKTDVPTENSNENPTQVNETSQISSQDSSVAFGEKDEINKEKNLECWTCSKKFATFLGLTIHQKEHKTNSGEFKCSVCLEMFTDYNLMTTHYLQVHSLEFSSLIVDDELPTEETDEELERYKNEFEFLFTRKCLICFQTFEMQRLGLSTYSQHVITHHSENKDLLKNFTYICSFCEKSHTLQHALEYHWKTLCFEKWQKENCENSGEIVCENCGIKFSNEHSLCSHVKVFHTGKKKVSCELCGKEVTSEATLKMHIKVIHEGEYKFTCEQCGKSFKLRQTLLKHMKSVHLGVKPFRCKFCSKQFVHKANLTAHENTHTGDKPYKCKHCDKTFPGRSALQVHAASHEEKVQIRLNCEICGKTLSPKSVASHKRYAHGDPQNSNFVCNICGKVYKSISSFKDHKYSHDGLKRFGCSLCEQTFTQTNHYHNHKKRTHANQNAQMVKLISEEEVPSNVHSNIILPTSNETTGVQTISPAETAIHNISNFSLELQDASKTVLAANNIAESVQNDTLHYSTLSSSFVDFSRANVPIVSSILTEDAPDDANIEKPEEQQYNVYMEGSGDDSVLPELNCNELLKIKIESPDGDAPITSDNQLDSNDASEIEKEEKIIKQSKTRRTKNVTKKKRTGRKGTYVKRKKLKSFACLYCEVNNLSSSQMVAHCSDEHPGKQPLKCKMCPKMFYHKKAYWNHKTKIHTKARPVLDPDGKGNFISDDHDKDSNGNSFVPGFDVQDLLQIKIETPNEDAPNGSNNLFDCSNDLSVGKKEMNINKQSTTVPQKKAYVKRSKLKNFDCFYCEVRCLSSGEMIAHCSDLHPGKESLKCKMCPKLFSNAQTYWNHKRKVHTYAKQPRDPNAKKEILCEVCGKAFLTKDSMATHRSNMHRPDMNVECDICHKTVRGKWNLRLHKQRHLGIKPHLCEECGMAFCSPQELREHVRVKHRGEKKRPRAKATTKTKRKHPFQCLLCPYSFVQEIGLQKHMELHDPERKYECDECGLRFRTYDIRFAHIKIKHKKIKRKRTPKTPSADV